MTPAAPKLLDVYYEVELGLPLQDDEPLPENGIEVERFGRWIKVAPAGKASIGMTFPIDSDAYNSDDTKRAAFRLAAKRANRGVDGKSPFILLGEVRVTHKGIIANTREH